jgi:hypothetical protein
MLALLAFAATLSFAQAGPQGFTDDSDLSGPANLRVQESPPLELKPDSIRSTATHGTGLKIQVVREDHGKITALEALDFQTAGCNGTNTKITATLGNGHFSVTNGGGTYFISFEAPCSGEVVASFKQDSNGGQALGIWQIAQKARAKVQSSIGLDFWKSPIDFVWPADADYYSWGQVHITRGDHWDVVGHEMGHAIYDLGELGQFGGGPHKIDECYSTEMALSEGWASYFSAWVSVNLDDADAKFEYMVPRRAPLRFETIPVDVCAGEKNEWRVTGFFWDLIDMNDDGENMNVSFPKVWDALKGSRVSSASQALKQLERSGLDPQLLQIIWKLNFMN